MWHPTHPHTRLVLLPAPRLQGPTLTLRIHSYSLMRDVVAAQSRPRLPPAAFKAPPLLVLNQFQGSGAAAGGSQQQQAAAQHIKLAGTLLQGMFPALHVSSMKVAACKVGPTGMAAAAAAVGPATL